MEVSSGSKGISILWNEDLEVSLREIKRMVSAENLLSYYHWKILFTVHTDASDKHLGAVISQKHKPIALFLIELIKPHSNYNTTDK